MGTVLIWGELWFLDVFSGMVAPLESLERQGFGPVGPKTQAFNEVEWRVQPFLDPMDPLKTSRKQNCFKALPWRR
jgi:hypothetical protein